MTTVEVITSVERRRRWSKRSPDCAGTDLAAKRDAAFRAIRERRRGPPRIARQGCKDSTATSRPRDPGYACLDCRIKSGNDENSQCWCAYRGNGRVRILAGSMTV